MEEDAEHRVVRTFIGLPASAKDSRGLYCDSAHDASVRSKTYDLFLRFRRGDKTVPKHALREAASRVTGARMCKANGQMKSLEENNEVFSQKNDVDAVLGLSDEAAIRLIDSMITETMLKSGHVT
jgi:hypothetical protein